VLARPLLERVIHAAHRTVLDRANPACRVGESVEANVGGDAVQPGAQRGTPFESFEALPGADHRLLDRVVGVPGGAEHPVAMPGERRAVGFELSDIERGDARRIRCRHDRKR
jgi:hypothetical protein